MSLVQQTYLYEVLARYSAAGLEGCHKIEITRIVNTDTGEVLSESLGSAVAISQAEAATLISTATLAPAPLKDEEPMEPITEEY